MFGFLSHIHEFDTHTQLFGLQVLWLWIATLF